MFLGFQVTKQLSEEKMQMEQEFQFTPLELLICIFFIKSRFNFISLPFMYPACAEIKIMRHIWVNVGILLF